VLLLESLLTYYLELEILIVSCRGKGELVSTISPQISSKGKPPKATLWPSLFAQKPLRNKPNQVKPALLSLLFGLDSVGVNATLVAPGDPFRQSSNLHFSEPSHPVGANGSAHRPPW
jgi:hypothetical protein